MILLKGLIGGIIAAVLAWILVLTVYLWLIERSTKPGELGSVAGGWNYLLQLPSVILALTAAFGIGLYLTVRLIARANLPVQ